VVARLALCLGLMHVCGGTRCAGYRQLVSYSYQGLRLNFYKNVKIIKEFFVTPKFSNAIVFAVRLSFSNIHIFVNLDQSMFFKALIEPTSFLGNIIVGTHFP
jgi:hypothetical protein